MSVDRATTPIGRARERIALHDHHGAVLLLEEAVRGEHAFPDAYNLLGLSLALIGRQADALAALDRAVSLNPRYVEAHLNRALVLNALGREDEARDAFDAAERSGREDHTGLPTVVANRLANAHADLAKIYLEAGSRGDAVAQLRRALELRPAYPDLRLSLARILLEGGENAAAARELEAVLEARPDLLDAMLLRGLCAYLEGDLGAAGSAWARAAERYPDEPRVQVYRAMLQRRRTAGE